jgi:hypothetical protein
MKTKLNSLPPPSISGEASKLDMDILLAMLVTEWSHFDSYLQKKLGRLFGTHVEVRAAKKEDALQANEGSDSGNSDGDAVAVAALTMNYAVFKTALLSQHGLPFEMKEGPLQRIYQRFGQAKFLSRQAACKSDWTERRDPDSGKVVFVIHVQPFFV